MIETEGIFIVGKPKQSSPAKLDIIDIFPALSLRPLKIFAQILRFSAFFAFVPEMNTRFSTFVKIFFNAVLYNFLTVPPYY